MSYLLAIATLTVITFITISFIQGRRLRGSPKVLLLHGLHPEQFETLLRLIGEAGLTVGTAQESLRDRTKVAITFDDGYDDLMGLVPILKNRPLPVIVFVPTEYIGRSNDWDHVFVKGRRRHLNEVQIQELARLGVQFGSHGHSHRDFTTLNNQEVQTEIDCSRRILLSIVGQEITTLAFPFGRSSNAVRQIAKRSRIELQFGSTPRVNQDGLLGRIPITESDNSFSIERKLRGGAVAGVEALKAGIISRFSHLTPVARKVLGTN